MSCACRESFSDRSRFVLAAMTDSSVSGNNLLQMSIFSLFLESEPKNRTLMVQETSQGCSCKSSCSTKRKGNSNRGCPCKGQNLLCGDSCRCDAKDKLCKNRVSCKREKIVMIAFRASLKHNPVRNYSDNYFRAF